MIDASGLSSALQEAFTYLRTGRRLLMIEHPEQPLVHNGSPDMVLKETKVTGLFGRRICNNWEKAEDLLTSGKLAASSIVTCRFVLGQLKSVFEAAFRGEGCKALLVTNQNWFSNNGQSLG